ncbi:jnk1/mapk8-associated membrane protein [Anaeramoeba ignava]|uniref:Jnk1/mapk8-associated membrane protein n=1 Tax=Anaeramoeba ignava TaxID=1746090 RepID=A0A9Q0LM00_ANAIG|nr:jnk1/mapk8-associated membrane protein [Anaeramoeba ignava]
MRNLFSFYFFIFILFIISVKSISICYDTDQCKIDFQTNYTKCGGTYCGRKYKNGEVTSLSCSSCQKGYRTDGYVCLPCKKNLTGYQWSYFVFFPVLITSYLIIITIFSTNVKRERLSHIVFSVVETVIAFFVTTITFPPYGNVKVTTCNSTALADWYTGFHNSNDNHCMSEAVFPLWSMVLAFFGYWFIFFMICRVIIWRYIEKAFFTTIFLRSIHPIPFFLLGFLLLSGLIYYSFSWILLIYSVSVDVIFYLYTFTKKKQIVGSYFLRYALLALSLYAITQQTGLDNNLYLIVVLVAPLIISPLYYFTQILTNPDDWEITDP